MSLQAVLLPLFVEVVLTFVLMLWMGARCRFLLRVSQGRRCRAARAELAAAHDAGGLFFLKSIRIAGIVLCSDHPRMDHPACRLRVCDPGVDIRRLPRTIGVRACDQQHLKVAQFLLLFGAVVLMVMWVIYIVEVLSGGSV